MAEEDNKGGGDGDQSQEKTEEPTQRRIEKAREQGSVARSVEVNSAFILIFSLLILYFIGSNIIVNLGDAMSKFFRQAGSVEINPTSVERISIQILITLSSAILPIALIIMVVGLSTNVAQVGLLFSSHSLQFSFDKMDPIKGLKRIFFSRRSVVELAKGITKVLVVAIVGFFSLKSVIDDSLMILDSNINVVMAFIGKSSLGVGMKMGLAFLVVAVFDYIFQWREHQRQLKMTKQELKDEMREHEGDPILKSRIRSIQRAMSRKRMLADVPKSDVIVTNPTHYAIALKYEMGKMDAPKVLAKGADLLAQKIKAIAIMHNIPIVEDQPLAQSLYKTVEIGDSIPEKLFKAVAEILAYVYRLKNTKFGFGMN